MRVLLALVLMPGVCRAASAPRPPLGATFYGSASGFADAAERLKTIKAEGFPLVSFVPTYPYVDLNKIDFAGGPEFEHLERALNAAFDEGFEVVLKPHLDPPAPAANSENHSWRKGASWRGYFDVDPMSLDYREGLILRTLELVGRALVLHPKAPPVRFDLGAELMNSVVYGAPQWEKLLAYARKQRRRLGLEKRVLFSHNFEHHIEIPGDVILRMEPAGRRALARYIKGLDAIALSQYMDLTAAMPEPERGKRLPSVDEVAAALLLHETRFREEVLGRELGIKPAQIPTLHIGEFGVGVGGLRHPNEWAGRLTPEQELKLAEEIARGHAGLARYLALDAGRTARSAVLWTVGPHYDVYGWGDRAFAIPSVAAADRAYLSGR